MGQSMLVKRDFLRIHTKEKNNMRQRILDRKGEDTVSKERKPRGTEHGSS